MARTDSLPESIGFHKSFFLSDNTAWTVQLDIRTLRRGEHGRATWPRATSPSNTIGIVTRAKAWRGQPHERPQSPLWGGIITWTFDPPTVTVNGTPVPLNQWVHLLEAAGVKWPSDVPRRQGPFIDKWAYLDAVAAFTERAKNEMWAISDPQRFSAAVIASYIGPDGITEDRMYIENRRAGISMDDIRKSRVNSSYLQIRRDLM